MRIWNKIFANNCEHEREQVKPVQRISEEREKMYKKQRFYNPESVLVCWEGSKKGGKGKIVLKFLSK